MTVDGLRVETDTRTRWCWPRSCRGFWALVILFWSDAPFALTFDDAWYYGEIGRNLAQGHGSTFDTINDTNGYHPLWQAICVLPRLLGLDVIAAMRAQLLIQLGCWIGAVVLLVRTGAPAVAGARRRRRPAGRQPVRAALRGQRAGVRRGRPRRGAAADPRRRTCRSPTTSPFGRRRFGALLALGLPGPDRRRAAHRSSAPLWVLPDVRRLGVDGRPSPRASCSPRRSSPSAVYVRRQPGRLRPPDADQRRHQAGRPDRRPSSLGVLVVAGRRLRHRAARCGASALSARFPQLTGFLAADRLVRPVLHRAGRLLHAALSASSWLWYFAPLVLYGVGLLVHGGADLLDGAAAEGPRSLRAVQAILLLPLLGGFLFLGRQFVDPDLRSIQEANRDAGRWISANLPEDAVVASWDAGVLGGFTDQPVVNLDGVVNSGDFADAMADGTGGEFLREAGVTHIANHGDSIDGDDPVARELVDELYGDRARDGARP